MDIRKDLKFKVNRLKVLKKLRFHRENFERLLKGALNNYQCECIRLLYERINEVNYICGGKLEKMNEDELKGLLEFNISPPKNFLYLYNEAIEIFSSISDEFIELNGEQINAFINNKWIL